MTETTTNPDVAWLVFWGNNEALDNAEAEARAQCTCDTCGHTLLYHEDGCNKSQCPCSCYLGPSPYLGEETLGPDQLCATLDEALAWIRGQAELLAQDASLSAESRQGASQWPAVFAQLMPNIRPDEDGEYTWEHVSGDLALGLWSQPTRARNQ